ncbi:MAG: hypothetical protein U0790_09345 [Isosphaeraceae bacterium]
MRSLFTKILVWLAGTAALAMAGQLVTARVLSARLPGRMDFISQTHQLQLESARQLYELGGPLKLAEYLDRLDQLYRARHVLLDANGVNLVDGSDRSDLLRLAGPPQGPPEMHEGEVVLSRTTDDGAYRLLIFLPRRSGRITSCPTSSGSSWRWSSSATSSPC